uniref:Striated muscle enriched protein kinase a n=1 Tax=Oncorhynchus mykiss TaxID=8022 RepID=A0A8C7NFQ2_ONCMY
GAREREGKRESEGERRSRTPPVFLRKLRKAAVGTGCDIRLRVSVGGQPAPSLFWYRNNDLLAPPGEKDVGGLWIRDCKASDAGLYTCVASNCLGEAQSSALLAVMDLGEGNVGETLGQHYDSSVLHLQMMDSSPDRRATLPGGHDPVVERELMALGSRPPGAQDPTHPGRQALCPSFSPASPQSSQTVSQPTTSLSSHKNSVTSHSTQDPSLGGAVVKNKLPGMFSGASSHTSSSGSSGGKTPKLARAAPKIFDKIKEFEQKVSEVSAGVRSGRSFGRAPSCDLEGVSKEEGTSQPDAAASRRSTFGKKRASSLEDKPSYQQRVQSFQNKFTEELARIKKLVGRPNLKKAYSTEQLPQMERQSVGKLEPIPPQVVKKLEEREKVLEERGLLGKSVEESFSSRKSSQSHEKGLTDQRNVPQREHTCLSVVGDDSDDSYMSADEGPAEKPAFERPLGDTIATAGSEVLLKCVITASPAQEALAIIREVRDVAVTAGELAMFECHMTGPLDVEVDWLSNGKLVQPALLNCKMTFNGKRCRLLLNSVHEDDSGTYTCKLSTANEELTSSAQLKVTPSREPLFTRKLDILEVIEGRTARFDCKVSGSPPPIVTWNHFENPVEESENVLLLQEGGRYSLVITHVSSDTEGFYTAVAKNAHGKAESTAELYMQEPRPAISSHMAKLEKMPSIAEEPEVLESEVEQEQRTMPDFVKPLADLEMIEGKEAVLKCKVAGLPYPTIAWYHNGKKIHSTDDRKMTQHRDIHSLVIRCVCHGHGGVYKSVISNKVGKAACYAHLYITDIVPDPPDGPPVVESITGKTITLSWKKPKRLDSSIDGSSLMYAVQQQPLGSIQWSIIASNLRETTYTVTGLSKGVRYAFRVLAATAKLLSKPSHSTDLVQLMDRGPYLRKAPIILDKPDIVYVVENQSVSITLTLNHVNAVVTWKRRGVVLLNKPGMFEMSMPDDDQHTLKIQRVKSTDTGQLVCTANNQFGSDLCTILLAMAVRPKFESIMEDLEIHVGETSRFAVVVEGQPDPDILWYKDDTLLSESSHFTFVYDDMECSLVVLNALPEDSGVYTCTAKNLAGQVSCKAELTVHKVRKEVEEPMEDEGSILRKMRRLTDYYDVHKEIGRGAFSYVKRVSEKKGKVEYAAKFVSARAKRKALALREMNLLSELNHEKILYFHDAFEKKNMVVIITELRYSVLQIRSSIQQVLEGVSYLHQKDIAHLDIKPENILMAGRHSDKIRICDFGNAVKLGTNEALYCKYGTPEFVAPEIVNQTPVSKTINITYFPSSLTGVSPFAGENDRCTVLNIRNQNVAFEESMFADLCREAKGFVIKLLVADRLRPNATESLRHPWFKTSIKDKSINTAILKQVLSRRRWQRSLISYKSKMVMRSIPELLNDSSNHISIAVARHLKEGSPPPSSSSDSDEDVDELPFIPMPLSMVFSGSRVSLNEIPGDEDVTGPPSRKRVTTEEDGGSSEEEKTAVKTKRVPLKKGSSVEEDDTQTKSRRATMRRGSSADSALLLHIEPEEGAVEEGKEDNGKKSLKKAVSMELPNRSPSPGAAKMSQEDYALKLELMRQRLLRGGNSKSGLRGPLLETLGMDDERRTSSLDRNLRRSRVGAPERSLARAASTECAVEDTTKIKMFQKSSSFSQGDSEPMPLHRQFGAPLEIPTSTSTITEQTRLDSRPYSHVPSSIQPTPVKEDQGAREEKKPEEKKKSKSEETSERDEETERRTKAQERVATERPTSPTISTSSSMVPDRPTTPRQPTTPLRTDIKDIDSEEVFESRFKKRESSLTRGLRRLTRTKSEEKSPTLPRKTGEGEEVYRPGRLGAPLEMVPQGLQEKSKSVQDLREVERDTGSLGIIGRFSMRTKRTPSIDKKEEKSKETEPVASKRRVSWAIGRSKSLDTTELDNIEARREQEARERKKMEESSVFAMRRKFENKVAGISASLRSKSEERKEEKEAKRRVEEEKSRKDAEEKDFKKVSDSPVLAMRKKFENKVAGISGKVRSQSEDRKEMEEEKPEGKKTPLFSRHRHSQSEGRGLKEMGIPENQLAKQTNKESKVSKESIGSASSLHSEKSKTPETDRRSRWDRWGLGRSRKDKTPSQTDLPSAKDEGSSDFPPVFHIKLRDHVLLEGDPVTLSCLPAGSPHPQISWTKDKRPLEMDNRMSLISCPDGRQLVTIMKTSRRDAGLYECVASNPLASVTSSCTLSLACVPKRPGTPEVPQTYNNTALVLWKPADTKPPCSYSLERKTEGDANWLIIATGVADCYYNVTDLPPGGAFRFRVACVNKAGQGPYSSTSDKVSLDSTAVMQPPGKTVSTVSPSSPSLTQTSLTFPAPTTALSPSTPSAPASPAITTPPTEHLVTPTTPLTLPSPPVVKPPPFVLPKPQSPVNVVPPMTQTPPISPPLPLVTPPSTPTKPVMASVPTYTSAATARMAPSPIPAPSFSPQVLQVSSLSPIGEGRGTPVRGTPRDRTTLKPGETALRQGVPQKPYTFLDEKARGRFGVVRECRENATGHVFMAKIIPYDQETKKSILQEYEILKSLHNDKVMTLHEAYVTPRYLVLVAEHCIGKELLHSLIDRFRYSEDDVVCYLVQLLQGLEYLHNRRVLHLDIKPDNVMVTNLNVIKIVDFGSAQNFNPLSLKQYNSGLGTLEYMSPEMVKGDVVGPPADIWSLGVLTYVMLSGRLPFQDKDPQQTETKIQIAKFDPTKLYPNVSQSASMFLKKMLSSYAWARPSTKDCFTHAWLQDSYLMKLRRQTLTFTTTKLKEFLGEHHRRRTDVATKHRVLLRSYSSSSETVPE